MKCSSCNIEINEQYPSKCIECGVTLCDSCAIENNFKCKKCTGGVNNEIKLEFVRRSYIELYKTCPYAFRLQVVEGKSVPSNVYAEVGIKLHECFDKASQGGYGHGNNEHEIKNAIIQEFTDFYKGLPRVSFEGMQKKLSIDSFIDQEYNKAMKSIEGYLEFEKDMPSPWKTEDTLLVSIDDDLPKIRITFDRINKLEDGTYDLVDYKTGKVYVGKKLAEDLQPALYIYAVEQNLHIPINRFRLLFTSEFKERVYKRIDDDTFACEVGRNEYRISISEKIDEVRNLFTQMKSGKLDIPYDINPWYCQNQCGSFKTGDCAGSFKGQWKNAVKESGK